MSNLFKTVIKTLLFFDLIAIIEHYFIAFNNKNENVALLLNNLTLTLLVGVFTAFYLFVVEKKKIVIPFKKQPISSTITGAIVGGFIPILGGCVFIILNIGEFIGLCGLSVSNLFKYSLPTVILSTLFSELLFRGYLYSLYKKHYGFWASAIITTGLWLAYNSHLLSGNKLLLTNLIILNILICCIYEITGSFITVLVARFVYIILSSFVLGSLPLEGVPVWLKTKGFSNYGLEGSIIFTLLSLALLYFFLYAKYDINKKVKTAAVGVYKRIKTFNFNELIVSIRFKFKQIKKKISKK